MLLILYHYPSVARLREPNSFGCEELGAEEKAMQGGASKQVKSVSNNCKLFVVDVEPLVR